MKGIIIKSIEVGGVKYPFHFGVAATRILKEEKGLELNEVFAKFSTESSGDNLGILTDMSDLIYAGLKAGALLNDEEFEYNSYQVDALVGLIMEENKFEEVTRLMVESMPGANGQESKKKKVKKLA